MKPGFRRGAPLAVAVAATFAIASTATAKGVDAPACAAINAFDNSPALGPDGATVTTSYSVLNACAGDGASIALEYRNATTGDRMRYISAMPYGTNESSNTWYASYETRYKIVITVYASDGEVLARQKQTVRTPVSG
jgi:hypothetical protein